MDLKVDGFQHVWRYFPALIIVLTVMMRLAVERRHRRAILFNRISKEV